MSDRTLLPQVVETFAQWLHLPDAGPLYAVLATVAANRMPGDPTWTMLVGPPGGGKTEIVQSTGGLADVHFAATLTEAALLSGTPKRDKASDATGGLLRQIGDSGIVVAKDFTSVLSMARDSRGQVLAALREIYDGSWTRHVGTDGGRTLHWSGKVGLIAGCTPTIDRHHAVMGAMGERFVLYRLPVADADELGRRALTHVGHEQRMRAELRDAVCSLFARLTIPAESPRLPDVAAERLVSLASFTVRARSAVERDGYTREIELIPDAEAPTRLVGVLARTLAALQLIGVPEEDAWRVTTKLALDCIPAIRLAIIERLATREHDSTADAAAALDYPPVTARRALEDLTAHRVCQRAKSGKSDVWRLTEWARDRYGAATTVPETPDSPLTPNPVEEGKSGKDAASRETALLAPSDRLVADEDGEWLPTRAER